jgi:UDP-2,4-diacetamido-2,4,6-trideoxy-beta-L-altropyranose hydrolase
MRCLVLAEVFRLKGHRCAFLTLTSDVDVVGIIKSKGFRTQDILSQSSVGYKSFTKKNKKFEEANNSCIATGIAFEPDLLVVDHYWIDYKWESFFRERGVKVLVLDDLANSNHNCDFLVHQTSVKDKKEYVSRVPPTAQIMLGFKYMILKSELSTARTFFQKLPLNSKNILVCFGLSDPNNLTKKVSEMLYNFEDDKKLQITILVGNSSTLNKIEQSLHRRYRNNVSISQMTANLDMMEIIGKSDCAVVAGGLLSIELTYLGVPCIVIPSSQIQEDVAHDLAKHANNKVMIKKAVNSELLGDIRSTLAKQRINSNRVFHPELDGRGAERIIERVLSGYEH